MVQQIYQVAQHHVRRVSLASKFFPPNAASVDWPSFREPVNKDENNHIGNGNQVTTEESRFKSYHLLEKLGLLKRVGHGTFAHLPLFERSVEKLKKLVETELECAGAHKITLPTLVPHKWWLKSGRQTRQADVMNDVYKLEDRKKEKFVLAPTHEETVTQLVASVCDLVPEKKLPLMVYQTTPKFRDEPRAKFGIIRSNEFLMNDLYTFDANEKAAKSTYDSICACYERLFTNLDLQCIKAESNTGNIGGSTSHEYQLPLPVGEDRVVICRSCNYAYNIQITDSTNCAKCQSKVLKYLAGCELGNSFILGTTYSEPFKALYKPTNPNQRSTPLHMGCYGLGVTRILGAGIEFASTELELRWPKHTEPYKIAIITPKAGSKFDADKLSTGYITKLVDTIVKQDSDVDVMIDDREKYTIAKKLLCTKALGIPNIIVVGGYRFNEEPPKFEFISLNSQTKTWSCDWYSYDQLVDRINQFNV